MRGSVHFAIWGVSFIYDLKAGGETFRLLLWLRFFVLAQRNCLPKPCSLAASCVVRS